MSTINFDNHFRDLFENTSDLTYFLNIDGSIELVNPAWLRALGYKQDEVIGRSIYEFIHPDYRAFYRAKREEVIRNNIILDFETGFITRDNQIIIGDAQVGCSYKNGIPNYTRCVFKNLTARKRVEKELEKSERRLKAFFESAPDAVIVINEQQEILEWNRKAEFIFGFTKEEIGGKTLSETIIPSQYREAHKKGMQHFLQTGEGAVLNKTVEITALRKNGNEFYISLSISNLWLDDRWLFIAFLSDISERKKTEEALIKKEAELMQSRLRDEKKDEFISVAGHELKTPVTTLKAYTQLALAKYKSHPSSIESYLIKTDHFADKLTRLLNELLDVSRIQLGKLHLCPIKVKVDVFLEEALQSMQYITNTHRIILEQDAAVEITIDPMRIEQVLVNLISNATKYSPSSDRIVVRSIKKENEIIVSVEDFGIGIPKENIDKIFGRYYRVDELSSQFSGLGIGLYISSEIIKQHGGKMWVESAEGVGSTFYFTIPVNN